MWIGQGFQPHCSDGLRWRVEGELIVIALADVAAGEDGCVFLHRQQRQVGCGRGRTQSSPANGRAAGLAQPLLEGGLGGRFAPFRHRTPIGDGSADLDAGPTDKVFRSLLVFQGNLEADARRKRNLLAKPNGQMVRLVQLVAPHIHRPTRLELVIDGIPGWESRLLHIGLRLMKGDFLNPVRGIQRSGGDLQFAEDKVSVRHPAGAFLRQSLIQQGVESESVDRGFPSGHHQGQRVGFRGDSGEQRRLVFHRAHCGSFFGPGFGEGRGGPYGFFNWELLR